MAGAAKYQPYPVYKPSDVEWLGDIPDGWEAKRLKHTVQQSRQITYGIVQAGPNLEVGIPYIRPADMTDEEGIRDTSSLMHTSPQIAADYERSKIRGGDLVCSIGPSFGKVMVVPDTLNGANLTQGTARIAIDKKTSAKFMFWALLSPITFQQWESSVGGATFRALNLGPLAETYLSLPPLPEQTKIAAFLDYETGKIDGLIAKQQRLIALLEEKRQAVISHAVTKGLDPTAPLRPSGIDWLGDVPAHWEVVKLSYRYEVLLGKMLDQAKVSGNYLGHYLRNTDVQWGDINTFDLPQMDFRPDEVERYSVARGDLIVCEGGEVGRCALWDKDETCFYQKALHRLRPIQKQRDSTRFFLNSLTASAKQGRFTSGLSSATIAHLPAEAFRQYRFAFPPHDEQLEIAEYLDKQEAKFDSLDEAAHSAITLLKERRTALISAAVTGKIDLRDWQAPAAATDTTHDKEVMA